MSVGSERLDALEAVAVEAITNTHGDLREDARFWIQRGIEGMRYAVAVESDAAGTDGGDWVEYRNVRVRPGGARYPWPTVTDEALALSQRRALVVAGIPAEEVETEGRTVTASEWRRVA